MSNALPTQKAMMFHGGDVTTLTESINNYLHAHPAHKVANISLGLLHTGTGNVYHKALVVFDLPKIKKGSKQ